MGVLLVYQRAGLTLWRSGVCGPLRSPRSACEVAAGAAQSGLLAQQTDPDPDGPGPALPRAQQFLYDPAGRQVGRRVGPAATIATAVVLLDGGL